MITTAAKWFFGLALVSFVLASAYGWSTGGTRLGPVTLGYWGAVGDHLGYTLLVSIAAAGGVLGLVAVITRDANPAALAEVAGVEEPPEAVAPAHLSYWPAIGAFGAALVALGLVISNVLFGIGCLVLLAVLIEWMVLAWSDHATGDADTNQVVRRRLLAPFEVPLAGFLVAAGSVVAISRVLLTSSELGAVAVACVFGVIVLVLGTLIATRPSLPPNVVAGVLSVVAIAVIAIGVASAARGERFIEHHEEEHTEEGEPEGNTPLTPEGTDANTTTTVAEEG
jgi:hypothetical protein